MVWVILYAIGIPVMYRFLAKRTPEWNDDHTIRQGRLVAGIFWPVCAPVVFLMWLHAVWEERQIVRESEDWHRRARGEG